MHEWPLFIFTLLMHASIGCISMAFICSLRLTASDQQSNLTLRSPLIVALVLGLLGLLASVFHLGKPIHMMYAITHFSSSWMSREIIVTAAYIALLLLSVWLLLYKKTISNTLLTLCVLLGFIDVFTMAQLYSSSIYPLWNTLFSSSQFYGSMFLLGGVVGGLTYLTTINRQLQTPAKSIVQQTILVFCVLGLSLLLMSALSFLTQLGAPLTTGIASKTLTTGTMMNMSIIRVVLIAVGIWALWKAFRPQHTNATLQVSTPFIFLGALSIIIAESLGRYVFFMLGA